MEDLIAQFSMLSNQALLDKNFDPSNIDDMMKLFEVEAYRSWAGMELECEAEAESAEKAMEEAEQELNSAMDSAMEEFRRLEENTMVKEAVDECNYLEKEAMDEYYSLVGAAEASRKMAKSVEAAASVASNKYVEAALLSATNSMKSAWKKAIKVHPS
ncbi:hypothetical protein vseg_009584 [Gypsophila vaccaria]